MHHLGQQLVIKARSDGDPHPFINDDLKGPRVVGGLGHLNGEKSGLLVSMPLGFSALGYRPPFPRLVPQRISVREFPPPPIKLVNCEFFLLAELENRHPATTLPPNALTPFAFQR